MNTDRRLSLQRKPISNEISNAACRWRIHVSQHRDNVAWTRADFEFAVHPWCAAAKAETSRAVNVRIDESIGVLTTQRRIGVSGCKHFRVLRIQQFVCLQRRCELQ